MSKKPETLEELTKLLAKLSRYSGKTIDVIVRCGHNHVSGKVQYDGELPALKGGWMLHRCDQLSDDMPTNIYIVPRNDQARAIWKIGQVRIGMRAGLSRNRATRWGRCANKDKHFWLELLGKLNNNPELVAHIKAYDESWSKTEFRAWLQKGDLGIHARKSRWDSLQKIVNSVFTDTD